MRNAKFWINKTSNQNIEGFTIVIIIQLLNVDISKSKKYVKYKNRFTCIFAMLE
jgi:hypothetical protein